ncbi:MAG: mandelate racemase, partial [Devosia sp.]|nr:mandelate racemase [Devosia sp.]
MDRSGKVITRFTFDEVIVPAKPGAVSSANINKPLHMLVSKGRAGWTVQFDELSKLMLRMELADGT